MIHNKNIMAALPILATVLGNKYGVEVRIGGDTACTDGNIIYLPDMPLDCDAQFIMQVRGFTDHESAHIRYTDFEALKQARLNPVQKYLWNALEDWRVENALAKIYPGCKGNFHKLIEEHFGKDKQTPYERAGQNPALSLLSYVLLTVRAWDAPSLEEQKETEAAIIENHFPKLLPQIDTILRRAKSHCQSTQNCIAYALELYKIMQQYVQNILQNEGDTQKEQLQKMLLADADAMPQHMGEILGASIQSQKSQNKGHSISVASEGHKTCTTFSSDTLEEIKRSSTALRTRLYGLLQANTQTPCILGRRGKLCSSKLHHVASHNPRVFLKHGHKNSLSTAVHLLLDCSGSMDGSKMELACKATYGVALALEHCQGVNVGVTAFPATVTGNQKSTTAVFPMLKHGQKVHPRFQVKASGCTPLTESLWWVMQQMYTLKEERKIIIILSDGVPDSLYTTKHALAHAHRLGFEVLALGMEDNSLEMLLPKTSRTIQDLNMLPSAMFSMLQQSLLKQ